MSHVESAVRALIEEVYQQQDVVLLVYRESHKLDHRSLKAVLARMEESFAVLEKLLTEASKETPLAVRHMRVAVNMLSYFPTLLVMRRWDLERHVPHDEVVDDLVGFILRGFGFESPSAGKQRKARNTGVKAHAVEES
jgi:GTPase SAR1 family protein